MLENGADQCAEGIFLNGEEACMSTFTIRAMEMARTAQTRADCDDMISQEYESRYDRER